MVSLALSAPSDTVNTDSMWHVAESPPGCCCCCRLHMAPPLAQINFHWQPVRPLRTQLPSCWVHSVLQSGSVNSSLSSQWTEVPPRLHTSHRLVYTSSQSISKFHSIFIWRKDLTCLLDITFLICADIFCCFVWKYSLKFALVFSEVSSWFSFLLLCSAVFEPFKKAFLHKIKTTFLH